MRRTYVFPILLLAGCSVSAIPPSSSLPQMLDFPPSVPRIEPGWNSLPDRPPVPNPRGASGDRVGYSDALGDVWEEDEENQWRGTWIRRGQSSLFDAYWVHPRGERVLAVVEIVQRREAVEISRRHPDGQGCTYRGVIETNRVDVRGWYRCSWHSHTSRWSAKIIRMRDVSPALLSNGGWRRTQ
jgi:hypothetical protein